MSALPSNSPVLWQPDQTGRLQPYSPLFRDVYRSSGADGAGGLAQARHAFLAGCGLLAGDVAAQPLWANKAHWHILETGFGLGLNFLASWQAWEAQRPALAARESAQPQHLVFSSIEAHPVQAADILQSAAPFTELTPYAQALAQVWQPQLGCNIWQWQCPAATSASALHPPRTLELRLYIGDVLDMLPLIAAPVHSIFLDGFSPQAERGENQKSSESSFGECMSDSDSDSHRHRHNNNAMWGEDCMRALAQLAEPGTRVASWTAAGVVRRRLAGAGFSVAKRAGLPPKRDSLYAVFPARI